MSVLRRATSGEGPTAGRLAEWLRELGKEGIHDPAGELVATFPEARQVPGLLRKSRKAAANERGGIDLNDVAYRAWQEGFLGEARTNATRPTSRDFLDALSSDLSGARVVRAGDREAARQAADFDRLLQALPGRGHRQPIADAAAMVRDMAGNIAALLDMDRQRRQACVGYLRNPAPRPFHSWMMLIAPPISTRSLTTFSPT